MDKIYRWNPPRARDKPSPYNENRKQNDENYQSSTNCTNNRTP